MTDVLPSTFGRRRSIGSCPSRRPTRAAAPLLTMAIDTTSIGTAPRSLDPTRPSPRAAASTSRRARSRPRTPLPRCRSGAWCATSRRSTGCAPWPCWPCSPTTGRRTWMPRRLPRRRGVLRHQRLPDHVAAAGRAEPHRAAPTSRPSGCAGPAGCCPRCSPCWSWCRRPGSSGTRARWPACAARWPPRSAYVTNWYLIAVKQSYFESVGRAVAAAAPVVAGGRGAVLPRLAAGAGRAAAPVPPAHAPRAAGHRGPGAPRSAVLGIALYHPGVDPYRVWYGTDTRAAGVLLGAALAIAVPPWRMRATVHRSAAVAVQRRWPWSRWPACCWMFVHVNEFDPFVYHGGFVLLDLVTVGLILSLVHPAATLVSRACWPPSRWCGSAAAPTASTCGTGRSSW